MSFDIRDLESNNFLTPWSRILIEKLMVVVVVKK
jgi:hypothetical protein